MEIPTSSELERERESSDEGHGEAEQERELPALPIKGCKTHASASRSVRTHLAEAHDAWLQSISNPTNSHDKTMLENPARSPSTSSLNLM